MNELDNLIEKLSTKTGGDLDTPTINADDLDAELAKILGDTGAGSATTAPETMVAPTTWSTTAEPQATVKSTETTSTIPMNTTTSTTTTTTSYNSADDVTNTSTTSTEEEKISKISEDPLAIQPITTNMPR